MTNKINKLDKYSKLNLSMAELVLADGVQTWLEYIKCMEIDVDNTSITLEICWGISKTMLTFMEVSI